MGLVSVIHAWSEFVSTAKGKYSACTTVQIRILKEPGSLIDVRIRGLDFEETLSSVGSRAATTPCHGPSQRLLRYANQCELLSHH